VKYVKKWENNRWYIKKKRRSRDRQIYKNLIKVIGILINNYILKSKISILKCEHKRKNLLYMLL